MARFSEEWLAQLLDKNDIADVIGEYVHLEKKGTRLWAACPWHAERNPSFCVTPEKQMFYCFSCKKGGSVINFIMEQEKMNYLEAVQFLAERVGMEMPEVQNDEAYQKKKAYTKRLQEMMKDLALHYHENLLQPEGKIAREYLKKRKISNVIRTYGLGFAKDTYDDAYRFLSAKGYSLREMMDAGVVRSKEGKNYDFFRNRVMFPIQNAFGDVIAFGGRVMDQGEPKYLNSGETYLFNKRYHLYALNQVRKKRDLKSIVLTEGYMDVVGLRAVGVDNVVASLGTALTKEQTRLIKKYTNRVYLCYDGDGAGIHASLRAIDLLQAEGLKTSVIVMPDGLDPDDFAKAYGKEAFLALMKESITGMEFKLKILRSEYNMEEPDQVVEYATKAVELVGGLENEIEKERYIRQISNDTKLSEQSLLRQMGKKNPSEMHTFVVNDRELIKKEVSEEEKLIALLMERPYLVQKNAQLFEGIFQQELHKKIFFYIFDEIKKGVLPTCAELLSVFSANSGQLAEALHQEIPEGTSAEDYAETLVKRVKISRLKEEREQLIGEMQKMDAAQRKEAMKQVSALNVQLHRMNDHFFRR